ncbi:hypothetical protein CDAR_462021, partial [Caerostris darwini]
MHGVRFVLQQHAHLSDSMRILQTTCAFFRQHAHSSDNMR